MHNTCTHTSKVKVTLRRQSLTWLIFKFRVSFYFFNNFIVAFADLALIIFLDWKSWDPYLYFEIAQLYAAWGGGRW
jgi:hypothetical protein